MKPEIAEQLIIQIYEGARMLNKLIKFRQEVKHAKIVKEDRGSYGIPDVEDPFSEF